MIGDLPTDTTSINKIDGMLDHDNAEVIFRIVNMTRLMEPVSPT